MAFERGFKARCENIAQSIRDDLGLRPSDPLPADVLADYLGARLVTPSEVPGMSAQSLRALLGDESSEWSAVTVSASGRVLVVCNPTNSAARRSSNIAHELSHVLLRHAPSTLMFAPDGTWTLRSYDERQEDEAAWLSGCLLLPRRALLTIANSKLRLDQAAGRYGVSVQLLRYRMDISGVTRQLGRRRAIGAQR